MTTEQTAASPWRPFCFRSCPPKTESRRGGSAAAFLLRIGARLFRLDSRKLAASLHESISAATPALKTAKPGALIQGGMVTVGFIAPQEIQALEE
jgi:hypothetical protein